MYLLLAMLFNFLGFGGNKESYLKGCEQIRNCTSALYNLQKNLLRTLLKNDDFTEKTPSSRKMFITMFRKFVFNNCLEHRMTVSRGKALLMI